MPENFGKIIPQYHLGDADGFSVKIIQKKILPQSSGTCRKNQTTAIEKGEHRCIYF
jgi:hypothetical protein